MPAIPLKTLKELFIVLDREKISPDSNITLYRILKKHLIISKNEMDMLYEQNPSIYAFWLVKYEGEAYKLKKLTRKYERDYGSKYMSEKLRCSRTTSETELKCRLSKDVNLNRMREHLDLMEYRVNIYKSVADIMKVRTEMITQLGSNVRKELGSQRDSVYEKSRPKPRRDLFANTKN